MAATLAIWTGSWQVSKFRTLLEQTLLNSMILLRVLAAVPGLATVAGLAFALPPIRSTAIILDAIAQVPIYLMPALIQSIWRSRSGKTAQRP